MTARPQPERSRRIGVLSFHNSKETKAILNAIEALGHEPVWLREANMETWMANGTVRFEPDVDVVVNRLLLTKASRPLEDLGVAGVYIDSHPVLNPPSAVLGAVHKAAAATSLVAAGIPVPDSVQIFDQSTFRAGLEAFGGEAVHKPAIGTNGQRLSLVSDDDSVPPAIGNRRTLLQEFIRTDGDTPWDIRVYVVDGHVLGAMRRYAPAGDWRTNVALGGDAEDGSDTLDSRAKQLARQATEVLGLDYAGIDLIRRHGDWYVLEVNPTAGFKGFFGTTGTSPAPHIAKMAVETVGGRVDDVHVRELARGLDDSVPACKPPVQDGPSDSQTVGFTEEITVNGTRDMTTVIAKADTGAKRTSIDTEIAATIGAGPILDTVQVTSGTQRVRQIRPVVEIQLRLAGWWHEVSVSIEDRSHMEYPVLLGRDVLTGHPVDLERRVDEE